MDEVEEEVAVPGEVLQSLRRALHPAADWRGAAGAGPALAPAAAAGWPAAAAVASCTQTAAPLMTAMKISQAVSIDYQSREQA